jgi:hypothetical protein
LNGIVLSLATLHPDSSGLALPPWNLATYSKELLILATGFTMYGRSPATKVEQISKENDKS